MRERKNIKDIGFQYNMYVYMVFETFHKQQQCNKALIKILNVIKH